MGPREEVAVTLDALKALTSKKRLDILYELSERRMTITELEERLDIPRGTLYTHTQKLVDAGFVERQEDRSWVYYNLTDSGAQIATSNAPRLRLLLSAFVGFLSAGGAVIAYSFTIPRVIPGPPDHGRPPNATPPDPNIIPASDPYVWLLAVGLLLVIVGVLGLGGIYRRLTTIVRGD